MFPSKFMAHSHNGNLFPTIANVHQNIPRPTYIPPSRCYASNEASPPTVNVSRNWLLDLVSSNHISGDISLFQTLEPISPITIQRMNGTTYMANHSGSIHIHITSDPAYDLPDVPITLTNVLYVPELQMNLLSTKRMANANVNVTFSTNGTSMFFNDHLLAHGIRIYDRYAFVASTEVKEPAYAPETERCLAYVATRAAESAPIILPSQTCAHRTENDHLPNPWTYVPITGTSDATSITPADIPSETNESRITEPINSEMIHTETSVNSRSEYSNDRTLPVANEHEADQDTARFEGVNAIPIKKELPSCEYETALSNANETQSARGIGHGTGELTSTSFETALEIDLAKGAMALSHTCDDTAEPTSTSKHILAQDTGHERTLLTSTIEKLPSTDLAGNAPASGHALKMELANEIDYGTDWLTSTPIKKLDFDPDWNGLASGHACEWRLVDETGKTLRHITSKPIGTAPHVDFTRNRLRLQTRWISAGHTEHETAKLTQKPLAKPPDTDPMAEDETRMTAQHILQIPERIFGRIQIPEVHFIPIQPITTLTGICIRNLRHTDRVRTYFDGFVHETKIGHANESRSVCKAERNASKIGLTTKPNAISLDAEQIEEVIIALTEDGSSGYGHTIALSDTSDEKNKTLTARSIAGPSDVDPMQDRRIFRTERDNPERTYESESAPTQHMSESPTANFDMIYAPTAHAIPILIIPTFPRHSTLTSRCIGANSAYHGWRNEKDVQRRHTDLVRHKIVECGCRAPHSKYDGGYGTNGPGIQRRFENEVHPYMLIIRTRPHYHRGHRSRCEHRALHRYNGILIYNTGYGMERHTSNTVKGPSNYGDAVALSNTSKRTLLGNTDEETSVNDVEYETKLRTWELVKKLPDISLTRMHQKFRAGRPRDPNRTGERESKTATYCLSQFTEPNSNVIHAPRNHTTSIRLITSPARSHDPYPPHPNANDAYIDRKRNGNIETRRPEDYVAERTARLTRRQRTDRGCKRPRYPRFRRCKPIARLMDRSMNTSVLRVRTLPAHIGQDRRIPLYPPPPFRKYSCFIHEDPSFCKHTYLPDALGVWHA